MFKGLMVGAKQPERGSDNPVQGGFMLRRLALLLFVLALSARSDAHVPSMEECLEGGDFISHAAQARDNGSTKAEFLERLTGDILMIQAFPPQLRWFVVDPDDAEFLHAESARVFDAPLQPEAHRAQFLSHCFERSRRIE